MKASASQPVIYARGNQTVTVSATIGPSMLTLDDGTQMTLSYEDRDFSITAADLVFGNATVSPQRGDVIRASSGNYTVLLEDTRDCWNWTDSSQTRYQIHTKKT